jgi:hypothetical protein
MSRAIPLLSLWTFTVYSGTTFTFTFIFYCLYRALPSNLTPLSFPDQNFVEIFSHCVLFALFNYRNDYSPYCYGIPGVISFRPPVLPLPCDQISMQNPTGHNHEYKMQSTAIQVVSLSPLHGASSANIINTQSRTADKGWCPSSGCATD